MYIIFENTVYDISKFIHPGGLKLIESAQGLDITEVFKSYHTKNSLHILKKLPILYEIKKNKSEIIKFSEEITEIKEHIYNSSKKWVSVDPYDTIMWSILFFYGVLNYINWHYRNIIFNTLSGILGGVMLIILGSYGHQYVHTSSTKSSMLTLAGFISNQWRGEHVFSHHPYTNMGAADYHDVKKTSGNKIANSSGQSPLNTNTESADNKYNMYHPPKKYDIDSMEFAKINKFMFFLPSFMKFLIVSSLIVWRPFILYISPSHIMKATKYDLLIICYNLLDLYMELGGGSINIYYLIKHYIPAMWFLVIDYFNHYVNTEYDNFENPSKKKDNGEMEWYDNQMKNTKNVVFNKKLYFKYPFLHSLLTFGLDRQLEHHMFPKIKMEHLSNIVPCVENIINIDDNTHYLGWHSFKHILYKFV